MEFLDQVSLPLVVEVEDCTEKDDVSNDERSFDQEETAKNTSM